MFPGDPSAEPANIYNCRCTLIVAVDGVDMSNAQRRARDPETGESVVIENMTYAEWAGWKEETGQVANPDKSGIMEQRVSKEIPEMTETPVPGRTLTPKDVTSEYLKAATPGQGAITYEDGYRTKGHQAEIAMAEWIYSTFGGDIQLLKESKEQGDRTPDFLWRDSHWELKVATSKNSVDRAVREAAKQIQAIPGGIVLDVTESDLSIEAIEEAINNRVRRIALDSVDVMIVSKEELKKIFRYKK